MKRETQYPIQKTAFGEERMMQLSEAASVLENAASTPPTDWLDTANVSSATYLLGDPRRALEIAQHALAQSRNPSTLLNVAVILETFGRFTEAMELILDAHLLDPHDSYVGTMCANSLLRLGRWQEAWPLFLRYQCDLGYLRPIIPEWFPSIPLAGKRLLVLDGGGYGDNIFFLRFLPRLKSLGAHVTLKCPIGLGPLVYNDPSIDRVIGGGPSDRVVEFYPKDYDYFVSILMLGERFGATVENYSWGGPYLRADAEQSALRRQVLVPGATPAIGICWKSGELESPLRHRTLLRAQVERILRSRVPTGCNWVSLVYDEPPPRLDDITMLEPAIRHWGDTAAILSCLKLVITTDTGVAHLAGALGVPVWVMIPGISAWQYLLGSDSHPFYPSMRLFRNEGEGIDNAVTKLIRALEEYPL